MNLSNDVVPKQQMDHWLQGAMLQREASAQTGKEITDASGQVYQKPKNKTLRRLCLKEDVSAKLLYC